MTVKVFLDISVIKETESSGNNIGKIVLNTTLVGILNTIFNLLKKKAKLEKLKVIYITLILRIEK